MATVKAKTGKRAKVVAGEAPAEGSGPATRGGRSVWAGALVVASITTAVYARVARQDFVHWDDRGHVIANPYLHRLDAANLLHFWAHPYEHLYIPLSYMAFAILSAIARMPHHDPSVTVLDTALNPHVFHTANLVLHVFNSLLVFAILRRLIDPPSKEASPWRREAPAVLGALLFAIHPLQVESVAWISELRGQLSSICCLGAIYLYVAAIQRTQNFDRHSDTRPSTMGPWSTRAYWTAFVLTVLGLLCKPSIITVGLLLIVIDRWMLGRSWRDCLMSAAPWLILALPFVWITHQAQPVSADGSGALWQRPFVAGDALAFYLAKFFAPFNLAIEYGRRPDVVLAHGLAMRTSIISLAVATNVFLLRKGRPWLVAGSLIAVVMLLPVLGLVPFAYQSYSTVADRYVYLSLLGPALIVGSIVRRAQEGAAGAPATAFAAGAIAFFGLVTMHQVRYWDNSVTLFAQAIRINPTGYGLRTNYGVSLDNIGRFDAAIAQYRQAEKLDPNGPDAYQDMGISLQHEKKDDEALACFRQAVEIAPDYPLGHAAIGLALLAENRPADALPELALAAKLAPADAQNRAHLAGCLQELGRVDEARDQYGKALAVDPYNVAALSGLAAIDVTAGRLADAESESRRAISLDPNDPAPHATLGNILKADGRVDEALAEFRRASALDPTSDALHFTLGSVLFQSGDRSDAIPELQAAAQLNPTPYHLDQLGVAYATVNNLTAARQDFEQAVRIDPTFAPSRKHIAMLNSQ